jgi:hypothetical protein
VEQSTVRTEYEFRPVGPEYEYEYEYEYKEPPEQDDAPK